MHIKDRLRIRKIDVYLLTEVLGPFSGGVAFFCFVFLMFQVLRFIIHGVSGLILTEMAGLLVLSFMPISLPIAFLIGVLIAFGRLSADSELVAMKANGMSLNRLSLPVIMLALGVAGISWGLNMEWVPWGDREFKSTLIKVSNTKVATSIKEGTFTTGFFDLLIYADRLDSKTSRLQHVFLFDEREPKNPMAVVANEGEILSVKNESKLGSAIMLKLYNGNIHTNQSDQDQYQKIDFKEYKLFLKIDEGADTATVKPRMIPYHELQHQIDVSTGPAKLELDTELWRRYAVATSPLIFVCLGIGFGTFRTRAVQAGAALIALVVILIYWSIQAVMTVLAHKGMIPPAIAMFIPNLVMAVAAWLGYRTAIW